MTIIVAVQGFMHASALWPPAASRDSVSAIFYLVVLAGASGWLPLLLYFQGLQLTRASTAGYFEMMQTLVAVVITWGWFGASLTWLQVAAAIVLIGAVAMVQRAQEATALPPPPEARVVNAGA